MATSKPVLLLTRPREASDRFAAMLPAGHRALVDLCFAPLIGIEPVGPPPALDPGEAVIFTSSNGVATASDMGLATNGAAFCVGERTTDAARSAGWNAQFMGNTADDLVAALITAPPGAALVHLSGTHTRGDIAGRLAQAGLSARNAAIYDQRLLPLPEAAASLLNTGRDVIAPLFSPRTARHFAGSLPAQARIHVIAISPAAAEPVENNGFASITVAKAPQAQAMLQSTCAVIDRLCPLEGGRTPQ